MPIANDPGGHGKGFGLQETRGELQPRWCGLRQCLVEQPGFPTAQEVAQDQARGLVPPLDAPEGELGLAHGLEQDRLVGAGSQPCRPGVAIQRV